MSREKRAVDCPIALKLGTWVHVLAVEVAGKKTKKNCLPEIDVTCRNMFYGRSDKILMMLRFEFES